MSGLFEPMFWSPKFVDADTSVIGPLYPLIGQEVVGIFKEDCACLGLVRCGPYFLMCLAARFCRTFI